MNALPWLFVHGPIVWQAALAALVLAALAVAFVRPRRAARRAAAAARETLGAPLASLPRLNDGMRLTLTGRLEAEGEPARRFEDGAETAAASVAYTPQVRSRRWLTGLNARAERLALVVGDTRLTLEGPVEVVAGSREVHRGQPFGRMPRAVQERVEASFKLGAPHFRDHVTVLRSIAPGDAVRVSGVLRKEAAGDGGGGYRGGAAERWALVPDGEAAQAALGASAPGGLRVAFEGAPRVSGPRAASYARHVAAGAALFFGVFVVGGEIALTTVHSTLDELERAPVDPRSPPRDVGMTAVAITAATPFRRLAAVEAMADTLDHRHDEDAVLVERRAGLHELHGDCVAAAQALARQGELERGAELAERCGDHRFAAEAFYTAGDFARASAAWEQLEPARAAGAPLDDRHASDAEARFAVRVHLLAGRTELAAKQALAFAGDLPGVTTQSRAALVRCLAVALGPQGGAKALADRRREESQTPMYPACAILLADLRQGKDRLDFIHGVTSFQSSAREVPMSWLELLEAEADPGVAPGPIPPLLDDPSLLVVNPSATLTLAIPGVDRALAEALAGEQPGPRDPRRATRARASAMAAAFAAIAGDAPTARRFSAITVESATALAPDEEFEHHEGNDPWDRSRAWSVSAAVELSLGDTERAALQLHTADTPYASAFSVGVSSLLAYRTRRDTTQLVERFLGWGLLDEGVNRAYALAAEGDGAALAEWLRRPSAEVGSYLRLGAPMIKTGREDVLRWIRIGYRVVGWYRSPVDQLVYWSELASAASALGDPPLAAQLAERAGRFRDALLRRDLAVKLAVLERL